MANNTKKMLLEFKEMLPAKALHTLALEGIAKALVDLTSLDDIAKVITYASQKKLKIVPLGSGSNLVFPKSADVLWLRPRFSQIDSIEENKHSVRLNVGAGVNWHEFVSYCVGQGWHGLENLALIPGTVGAAPIQNIGAYGVEIEQFIESVEIVSLASNSLTKKVLEHKTISHRECQFAYRDSVFKHDLKDKVLVTAVNFRLQKGFTPNLNYAELKEYFETTNINSIAKEKSVVERSDIEKPVVEKCVVAKNTPEKNVLEKSNTYCDSAKKLFDAVVAIRQQKLPAPDLCPNAGSFFKNPLVSIEKVDALKKQHPTIPSFNMPGDYDHKKLSAAWLIQTSGLKGFENKGIKVSDKHALVLENVSQNHNRQSTADDVLEMVKHIQDKVQQNFAVKLEVEPRIRF